MQQHAARVGEADDSGRNARDGVDWSALKGSPPDALVETLAWIRREHGSIDGYLSEAVPGDAEAWRRKLLNAVRLRA